jgi:DNA segregation ATPase FtsK/SpoIIIE, S-DNA-T family
VSRTSVAATWTKAGAVRGQRADALLAPPLRLSLGAVLAINAGRLLRRVAGAVVAHPVLTVVLSVVLALDLLVGPTRLLLDAMAVATALGCWRLARPASFTRWVGAPVRSPWRAWWRYRRHWQPVMATTGLTTSLAGTEYVPRLRRVVCTACVDSALVGLLAGQAPADYEDQVEELAHTFRALSCRVRVDRPGRVWLDFTHTDPLTAPIPALPVPEVPDFSGLALGVTAGGSPWQLRLLGSHVLISGATGSGKGSVLWSLVRALAGGIRIGTVQLWAIDPKGGMELAFGAPMFHRLAYRTADDMLLLLEDAVTAMRDRQARLLGLTRLHQPTTTEPLVVVLVDELAALTAYTDRDTKRKAAELLQLLLSQGRAVGVLVVAALQDPGKDVLPFRDLFPTRIALRLVEDVQVDMVLGRGARDRGAHCDRIPETLPGVGYVALEGRREPVRVRAAHVTDADLAAMCATYAPPDATETAWPVVVGQPTGTGAGEAAA